MRGDVGHVGVAQPRRRFDQRIEHGLQIEGRAADHLEHVGGGGLLLQRFAQLVEQPRVLDGDDRLGGEVLHQLDLLVGEWAHLLTIDGDGANQLLVLEHRHEHDRPGTAKLGRWSSDRIGGVIYRVNNLFGFHHAIHSTS